MHLFKAFITSLLLNFIYAAHGGYFEDQNESVNERSYSRGREYWKLIWKSVTV